MFLSGPSWRLQYCLAVILAFALAVPLGAARAGDLEDCNSSVAEKVATGCTALIENPATAPADNQNARVNRARMYTNRGDLDHALADAEAALNLDAQSVPALIVRGAAYQRKNDLDSALADYRARI